MDTLEPLLETKNLDLGIGPVEICSGLEITLATGQCWGLLGRNGAGKTTLLHTLAGLHPPRAGSIRIGGRSLSTLERRQRARLVGLLPQDTDDPFPSTVVETVLIGRHPYLRPWQLEGPEDLAHAEAALAMVGLSSLSRRDVGTLSGGERRRLALATLLCQAPSLMLLDEPTNHLDLHYQIKLLTLIRDQVRTGPRAALLSLHDVNLALRFCSHALLLYGDGEWCLGPIDEVVDCASLQRLYRHKMIETGTASRKLYIPA